MQSIRTTPGQPLLQQRSTSGERAKEIADLVGRMGAIDTTLCTVRDLIRFYADMAHELPDESKCITVDAQAMRGTMTFLFGHVEDAIESLGTVQAMVSLLDDESDS
ncbi:MAG TPA: hypothetical protein VF450_21195 [Noviherbaspirillum sp.]